MPDKIQEKVSAYIKKQDLIHCGDRILLGLSGGADSVCLFYLLAALRKEFGFELRAVHVHHGIRAEAEEDALYAEALCRKEGIVCRIFRENVPVFAKEQGLTQEEAGRKLRYRDFYRALSDWRKEEEGEEEHYKIAVAHHLNDQAETVLFQLFRGSGLSGLRGILPERENIIRPILCLLREETENYLKERKIAWREDATNASEDYCRNKIRHSIIPFAEREICSGAVKHIGKSAEILQEAERYFRRQTEDAFQRVTADRDGKEGLKEGFVIFDIPELRKEDPFLQKQVILYGLEQAVEGKRDIGAVHIEDIMKLLQKQGNGELSLPGGINIKKVYRKLFVFRNGQECAEKEITKFSMEERGFLYGESAPEMEIKRFSVSDEKEAGEHFLTGIPQKMYTKWFDYDKIETSYLLRHRKIGDYFTINSRMNRKSIKDYMVQEKIPASVRDEIWLLADGGHVMWIPGGRISAYYKVTDQTKTILQVRIITGKSTGNGG